MEQIISMELAVSGVKQDVQRLAVHFICSPGQAMIGASDPVTGKFIQRNIPMTSVKWDGRERALALAASQLFVASWLELLMPEKKRPNTAPQAQPMEEVAKKIASEAIGEPTVPYELNGSGGVRIRDFKSPIATTAIEAEFSGNLAGELRLLGGIGGEFGTAVRSTGDVHLAAMMLRLGAAWRRVVADPFALRAAFLISGGYVRLAGTASERGFETANIGGFTGDWSLCLSPMIILNRVIIRLDLQGGYTLKTPVGYVAEDDSVTLGGVWVGALITVGVRLGG